MPDIFSLDDIRSTYDLVQVEPSFDEEFDILSVDSTRRQVQDAQPLGFLTRTAGRQGEVVRRSVLSVLDSLDRLPFAVAMSVIKRTDPKRYALLKSHEEEVEAYMREKAQQYGGLKAIAAEAFIPSQDFQDILATKVSESKEIESEYFRKSEEASVGVLAGWKNPKWWMENIPDVAIQLLMAYGLEQVTGGAGLAFMSVESGSETYLEAKQRLGVDDPDDELLAIGEGAAMGLIEAVLEAPVLKKIADTPGTKQGVFEMAIKKIAGPRAATAGLRAATIVGAGAGEAKEELLAEFSGDVMQYILEKDPTAFDDAVDRYATAATLGAVGGLGAASAVHGTKTAIDEMMLRSTGENRARTQARALLSTQKGRDDLIVLGGKDQQSRKDFELAGFKNVRLSQEQRKEYAKTYADSAKEVNGLLAAANKALEEWLKPPPAIAPEAEPEVIPGIVPPEVTPGVTPPEVTPKVTPPTPTVTPEQQELADLTKKIEETFTKDVKKGPELSRAVAEVMRASLPANKLQQVRFEKGTDKVVPKAEDSALYQIPEAVAEILADDKFKSTRNEEEFFHPTKGIWSRAISKARRLGYRGAQGLSNVATRLWSQHVRDSKDRIEAGIAPSTKVPFGHSEAFDKTVSEEGIMSAAREFVRDIIPFMKSHPQFREYYRDELSRFREVISTKHPEIASDDSLFAFYTLLNGIGSAQTELRSNIEETDAAYGGFVQTGRIPVVFDEAGRPIYSLPENVEIDQIVEAINRINAGQPAEDNLKALGTHNVHTVRRAVETYNQLGDKEFRQRALTAFTIYGGSSIRNKARNYEIINTLLDRFNGDVGSVISWLTERVPIQQLEAEKTELGFAGVQDKTDILDTVWVAESQNKSIPRAFLFGPKVGAYTLNLLGDSRYNTMDVWESRAWRSYFRSPKDTDPGIAGGVPRRVYLRAAKAFPIAYKEATGEDISISAGQAARWYYIKGAVEKAGYLKAAGDKTMSEYADEIIKQWVTNELIGNRNDINEIYEFIAAAKKGKRPTKEVKAIATERAVERMELEAEKGRVREEAVEEAKKGIITKEIAVTPPQPAIEEVEVAKRVKKVKVKAVVPDVQRVVEAVRTLFQQEGPVARGKMEELPGGDVLITAFEGANIDTALEEIAHAVRRLNLRWDIPAEARGLSNSDLRTIEKWSGVKEKGQWDRKSEEKFAAGYRNTILTGKAPTKALKGPFKTLRRYLENLYNIIKSPASNVKMGKNVRAAFERIFEVRERAEAFRGKDKTPAPAAKKAAEVATSSKLTETGETAESKAGTVPPEYVTDGKVVLYRFSQQDRGDTYSIDPSQTTPNYYSRNDYQRAGTKRTFFYLNSSEREDVVGRFLYAAEINADRIYNLISDTEGIKAKYKSGAVYDFDSIFSELISKGYAGVYYNPGMHVVSLFEEISGKRIPDPNQTLDAEGIWNSVNKQIKAGEPAGFTLNPASGESVESGYAVSPAKGAEYVIDLSTAKDIPGLIRRYIGRISSILNKKGFHLGGWVDGGKLYMDVSIITDSRGEAIDVAKRNDQLAIFDLTTKNTIRINEEGVSEYRTGQHSLIPVHTAKPSKVEISKREVINNILSRANIVISGSFQGISQRVKGYYQWIISGPKYQFPGRELNIRAKYLHEIGTAVHEVAHFLDDTFNITGFKKDADPHKALFSQLRPFEVNAIATLDYDPLARRVEEGFAEALRIWATFDDPRPYFGDTVNKAIDKIMAANTELANQLMLMKQDVMNYAGQTDSQKVAHAMAYSGQKIIDPRNTFFQRRDANYGKALVRLLERKVFDMDYDLVVAEREIESNFKENFETLPDQVKAGRTAADAWEEVVRESGGLPHQMKMTTTTASTENSHEAITRGVFDPETGDQIGKEIPIDIFKEFTEEEKEEFGQYMYAKVALERYDRSGGKYVPGEVDVKTLHHFVGTIESGKNKGKYSAASVRVTAYFNELIKLLRVNGLLSGREESAIIKSHKLYMPFFRQFHQSQGAGSRRILGVGPPIGKLKQGSIMPVLDVYDALIDRTYNVYSAINRHLVEKAFVDIATKSGVGAPFITRIHDNVDAVMKPDEMLDILEAEDLMPPDDIDYYREKVKDGTLTKEDQTDLWSWFVYGQPAFKNALKGNVIAYRRPDGSVVRYKIDPDIHRVATFANNPQMGKMAGWILGILGIPTTISKKMMVSLNLPYFTPKNLPRDIKTALIKGLQDVSGMKLGNVTPGVVTLIPAQMKHVFNSEFGKQESDVDKLYRRLGGLKTTKLRASWQGGWASRRERRSMFGLKRRGKWNHLVDRTADVFDTLESLNNVVELAPRKAAFLRTLLELAKTTDTFTVDKAGKITGTVPTWASSRAMYNALEITVNFSRRGEWSRYLEPIVLFYNANLQGTNSQLMTAIGAKQDPRKLARVVSTLAIGVLAKGMALALMASLLVHPEDEEDETTFLDKYWEVPDYYKKTQDVFLTRLFGTNVSLTLPTEREWKIVGDVAEELIWKPLFKMAGVRVPEPTTPAMDQATTRLFEEFGARVPFTGGTVPVALQLLFGKDLFRWKDIENERDKKKLIEYRYDDRTSWAHPISKWGLNHPAVLGGLSPKEIDFLVRNTTGSLVPNLVAFTSGLLKGTSNRGFSKTPFVGPFLADDTPRQSEIDFYVVSRKNTMMLHAYSEGMPMTESEVVEIRENEAAYGIAQRLAGEIDRTSDEEIPPEMKARYKTGLYRWALQRKSLSEYPLILQKYNEDLPLELRKETVSAIKSVFRLPQKVDMTTEEGRETYFQKVKAKRRLGRRIYEEKT